MAIKYSIPRGTSDILPMDAYKWQYVEDVFRKVATSFGYQEISTPIFEYEEVFTRSSGETSDIVQKEMYRFSDRKDRILALRPEGTAPVIRSYIENNLGAEGNIVKLFYIGQMFRYNRPQAGRSRQFSQYGAECIGSNHPYYDAELIGVFHTFLKKLGLNNFVIEINSIGCPDCSEIYNRALKEYFQPNYDELCPDCQNRFDKNPKRLLDCKVEKCKSFAENTPSMLDYLDDKCKQHFKEVQEYLSILEIPFIINPKIVRGLDYYTQTAFEVIPDNKSTAQAALGGGGRYDGLIEMMGGKDTPAVGFAGGFSRLLLSLEQEKLYLGTQPSPKYYIVTLGDEVIPTAIKLLSFFRSNNIYIEFEIEKKSMKSQMKSADRFKAKYVIILGETEFQQNKLSLKNMESGEQREISIEHLEELL